MKLPNPEKFEIIVNSPKNNNKKILAQILSNVRSIKQIEKENAELKKKLIESQTHVKEDKIQDLIKILNHKEKKFNEFYNNILDNYKKYKSNINKVVEQEKKRHKELKENYKELLIYSNKKKKQVDYLKNNNLKTKFLLKKDFEKRLNKVVDEYKLHKKSHRDVIKENEEFKLEIKKQLELERKKAAFLAKKNSELIDMNKEIEKEKLNFMEINKKLLLRLNNINKRSIGNKKVLDNKIENMRKELELKLKDVTKQHLDKEIEYKATIDSLKKDLSKYYTELRTLKQKYYRREKELKKNIKQFTQLL